MNKYKIQYIDDNWVITTSKQNVKTITPSEFTIYMEDCKLINKNGEVYIESKGVVTYHRIPDDFIQGGKKIVYNPLVEEHWLMISQTDKELVSKNVDGKKVGNLVTINKQILTSE